MALAAAGAWLATWAARWLGRKLNALDAQGVVGQIKAPVRAIPNTGGIGLFLGFAALGGLIALVGPFVPSLGWQGFDPANAGWSVPCLLALLAVHVAGVIDDRRPLPWAPKLLVMLAVPAWLAWTTDTRVLTLADGWAGGPWLSIAITALWFAVVMNAMNFLDNMDGLAAGTSAVIAASIAGVAWVQESSGVVLGASVLSASCLGFLLHNFPRARVFMGDGGSLVIGFLLAFFTTRLTYLDPEAVEPRWDRLAIPLILLAVPLYDLASVVIIRLAQGRSPFVGDLQHLSHRFERRGLSRPRVAVSVWLLAAICGLAAVVMARAEPWQAALLAVQTAATLVLLALVERGMASGTGRP